MDWYERLFTSVKDGDYENVKEMLKDHISFEIEIEVPFESPLIRAIDNNDFHMVELLATYKWRIREESCQPNPIIHATVNDLVDANVVKALINSNTDVNERDHHERNALHLAAMHNYVDKIEMLLQSSRLNTNAIDINGKNALHHLVEGTSFDDIEEFKRGASLLLHKGVNVNVQDQMRETPLHKVFQFYDDLIPQILTFLLQNAEDFNHELKDLDGYTVFHIMVTNLDDRLDQKDNLEEIIESRKQLILDYLTCKIVDISDTVRTRLLNEPDMKGSSAFSTYIDSQHISLETIETMMTTGADINTSNGIGITPLMQALLRKRENVVDILLTAGVNVNTTDIFDQTALFRCRTNHSFDRLCESGANLNVKDRFWRSPLANRLLYTPTELPSFGIVIDSDLTSSPPLAISFLNHGVDVNTLDRYGSSFLHYAAWHSDLNMINILLERNALKDIIDKNGFTPYDLAVYHGNHETYPLLDKVPRALHGEGSDLEKQKRFSRYVRFVINHSETNDMKRTLQLAGISDDPEDLVKTLLYSPRTGLTDRLNDSIEIKNDVHELITKIARKVSELDSRFQCRMFPTGSSAERSQISERSEMDFVFCLTYFEEVCDVVQTNDILNSGFAHLKLKKCEKSHSLIMFADENNILLSYRVRDRFQDLIVCAVNKGEIWSSKNMFFDGLVGFPNDKPIVNLQIQWFGALTKDITISIDIVPAVYKRNWIPENIDPSKMAPISEKVRETGFFLLFHTPEFNSESWDSAKFVRISSAPIEIEILQNIPDIFRESYALSKILKNMYFCPPVQFSDDEYDSLDDEIDSTCEMEDQNEFVNSSDFENNARQEKEISMSQLPPTSAKEQETSDTILTQTSPIPEKTPGWVLRLDNSVVRQIYVPKENKAKPLEKVFSVLSESPNAEIRIIKDFERFDTRDNSFCDNEPPIKEVQTSSVYGVERNKQSESCVITSCLQKRLPTSHIPTSTVSGEISERTESYMHNNSVVGAESMELCPSRIQSSSVYAVECTDLSASGKNNSKTKCISEIEKEKGECINNESQAKVSEGLILDSSDRYLLTINSIKSEEVLYTRSPNEIGDMQCIYESSEDEESLCTSNISDEFVGGSIVYARDEISSYMLKNCLFYSVLKTENNTKQDLSRLKITKMIYQKLLESAREKHLPAYVLPHINIFTYVNTHIRIMSPNKVDKELTKHCARIETFCKLILGILSQTEAQ